VADLLVETGHERGRRHQASFVRHALPYWYGARVAKKAKKRAKTERSGHRPKKKCCVSSTKCARCPLRMLKDGTLPAGYTVKKRRLVRVELDAA